MTVVTIFLALLNVAVVAAGIAFFRPIRDALRRSGNTDTLGDDADKSASLFKAVQDALTRHATSLKAVGDAEAEPPSQECIQGMREVNRATSGALDRDTKQLGSILSKYGDLYRSERHRIETYTQNVSELDHLLADSEADAEGSQRILLQFVREMVQENRQLQLKVSDCQEQVTDLIKRSVRSERDARTDPLSQLPNRRAWDEKLAALESEGLIAIALIDVDDFKVINDGHGHAAGDSMLTLIGTILRNSHEASAYRIGGDEFALLISAGSERVAAERIRNRVSAAVLQYAGEKLSVSVSIGVATRNEGESLPAVLRRADDALYRAKATKGEECRVPQLA